jgi:competence protein ComEC
MKRRLRLTAGILLAACLALALSSCAPKPERQSVAGELVVRFLDVGQGDSILLTLPNGTSMLIDAGPRDAGDDIVSAIKDQGLKKLDYVIFTHPHEDHIGGAVTVLKGLEVGEVAMPRTSHTTQTYENLLNAIDGKGLTVTEAKAGKVLFDKDGIRAWFIGPSRTFSELNDMSAVLALKYGSRTFLFDGDAGKDSEAAMTLSSSVQIPEADVLKVAHHGSETSSTETFIELVSPTIAVISVGKGNDYGHPTEEAIARLRAVGAEVYRTDLNGTITVTTDGSKMDVKTER